MAPALPDGPAWRSTTPETRRAFRELIGEVAALEEGLHRIHGAPLDENTQVDGYRWLLTLLQVGTDIHLRADPRRPRLRELIGPERKWGGDSPDADIRHTPLDPTCRYLVRGHRAEAAYLSLTVYGGPGDGRFSTRIVGSVNHRDLGEHFEIMLSAGPPPRSFTGSWLKLDPDTECAITRSYVGRPGRDPHASWDIEALDPAPPRPAGDLPSASGLRAMRTWMHEQASLVFHLSDDNTVDPPFPVPRHTLGWAAGDAAYAAGSYALGDDEALIIRGSPVECAFWNLTLWNPFMHSFDGERIGVNSAQTLTRPDGSWEIVIAHRDPGRPNWIRTEGRPRGRMWFRWFLPETTPPAPTTELLKLGRQTAS
jgi:hypothetical protein